MHTRTLACSLILSRLDYCNACKLSRSVLQVCFVCTSYKTDLDNLHALQYIAVRYGVPPAVNHMQTYASAALRTSYAPPAHTAPYRTARGLWVPGPAHGIAESRGGRPSNPTHNYILHFLTVTTANTHFAYPQKDGQAELIKYQCQTAINLDLHMIIIIVSFLLCHYVGLYTGPSCVFCL